MRHLNTLTDTITWQVTSTGQYVTVLVIAKVRERLAVGNQAAERLDRQTFNLSKLNDLEVRKQYQIDITNRFAALENLNEDEDVNRTWGT